MRSRIIPHTTSLIHQEKSRDLLLHLYYQNSMDSDGIYLRVPRELAEVFIKPLSNVYQQFWSITEVLDNCRLSKGTSVDKEAQKKDPGNCRP